MDSMDQQSSSSSTEHKIGCGTGDGGGGEEQENGLARQQEKQQQQEQQLSWCPFVGHRFRDPDVFTLEVKAYASKQQLLGEKTGGGCVGFFIGKSFTYDRNPSAVAKNGGIAPCPKGILYCASLPGGSKKGGANPCPWRLQFGYRARTNDYEVTKFMDKHCCHDIVAINGDGTGRSGTGTCADVQVKKLQQQYAKGSAETALVVEFDQDWRPTLGERFVNPGLYLGLMRAWGKHDGFKVARSFSYTKTPSAVALNGGVEPIQKGIIYCSTLTGGVAKNPCPCRVQFGWRAKARDYEVIKVDTEHCHQLGNIETNNDAAAFTILPGAKLRPDSIKRALNQQQQQQHHRQEPVPYITAETAGATEWQPAAGQRFTCPEQFVGIVREYASRFGFTVAHSFTYSSSSSKTTSANISGRGGVEKTPVVQKGILYCNSLEKTGEYAPCPFRIDFSVRVKTMDYVVTKVSTSHCHTLNATTAAVAAASNISPPTFAATATTTAHARHSAVMSRCEKICKLAKTDASYRFLIAALGDLETQLKEINQKEEAASSSSSSSGQNNQAPAQLPSPPPTQAGAAVAANKRRSPSYSSGSKRGRKTGNDESNHETDYNSNDMDHPVGKRQNPDCGTQGGWM